MLRLPTWILCMVSGTEIRVVKFPIECVFEEIPLLSDFHNQVWNTDKPCKIVMHSSSN